MSSSSPAETVSIVIPVYFNEESLPLLDEKLADLEGHEALDGLKLELIYVDDGSGDASLQRLMEIRERRPGTKIVKLTRNFGAIAASKTGMGYATGDCVVLVAADLQDPVEVVAEMIERWRKGSRFVICSRAKRGDPALTRLWSTLYYRVVRRLIIDDYPIGGFDMMLLDRDLAVTIADSAPNTNIHLYAYWLGYTPAVLNYDRPKRRHGRSRWTLAKRLKLFSDTMTGFSVIPLRLLSVFGLMVALASFAYGLVILFNALLGNFEVRGFATIAVLISFFFGLVLIMLGLIGEYLWRIFENTTRKPESVVDATFF